jgi:hypothetical protein
MAAAFARLARAWPAQQCAQALRTVAAAHAPRAAGAPLAGRPLASAFVGRTLPAPLARARSFMAMPQAEMKAHVGLVTEPDVVAAEREADAERALRRKAEEATQKFHLTPVDAKARARARARRAPAAQRARPPGRAHACAHHCRASQVLQRMLDELGLDTPGKLRGFVTKRSLPVLGLSLLESVLNATGSYCALMIFALMPWDAALLVQRGWAPWLAAGLAGAGQGAAALAAAALGVNAIFAGATFLATLYATIAFDINARGFLECVHRVRAPPARAGAQRSACARAASEAMRGARARLARSLLTFRR